MRMNRMRTYSVIVVTRENERLGYLINAETAEEAKRKAIGKVGMCGIRAPYREIVVYTSEQVWAAMGN